MTEGEIDAMSIFQMQEGKWPVVSIPNGAPNAAKSFRENLEFLNSYDEVVICFDNDEAGKAGAIEAAMELTPGKAKIAQLSLKDANEHLLAGDSRTVITALWEAQTYRPDGILHVKDVKLGGSKDMKVWDYPWMCMTKALYGRRSGELVMHTSGSGMGKSTVIRELILADIQAGENVGVLMLEESTQDTKHDLMSLLLNKPIKRILAARKMNEMRRASGKNAIDFDIVDDLTDEEYEGAVVQIEGRNLFLYDHFGSQDCDTLIHKLEYMVKSLGCTKIYLDHVSIVISGMDSGNERKDIDVLMTKLRSFVEQTDCHVDAVCHLTKPQGQPFEEGGQISLRDLRGSGSLYQLADSVLGYERDQQHQDRKVANTIMIRSLKDRFGGFTGLCGALYYDKEHGRLKEIEWTTDADGNIVHSWDSLETEVFASVADEGDDAGDDLLN